MLEKIEGIVLDIVRHNDSHNVVTLYTRERGRMSFIVPVGKSKAGRMRNSAIMLLANLHAEVNFKAGKELQMMRNVMTGEIRRTLYFNPVKSTLIFFLSEFLNKLLRQSPRDRQLYAYISDSIRLLDETDERRLANFHIAFLLGILALTGVFPSPETYKEGMIFDMQQGNFEYPEMMMFRKGGVILSAEESKVVPMVLRMNFRNMHLFRFNRNEKDQLLDKLLQYFSLHLPMGYKLRSIDILHELLD